MVVTAKHRAAMPRPIPAETEPKNKSKSVAIDMKVIGKSLISKSKNKAMEAK
jgi:hypothetical protein